MSRTILRKYYDNNTMNQKTVDNIRENIAHLMGLRNIPSMNALSKSAKIADKTLSNLMANDIISNPTIKVLDNISKVLQVEPWMLLIKDFPFDQMKGKQLKTMSGPTYVVANAMEQEPLSVQILMMEAASYALMRIDKKQSEAIKEAQATYLNNDNQ